MVATAIHTVTHQLSGMLLNAVDDNACRWWATSVDDGESTPPVKLRSANRPYGPGGYRARSYWGPRLLTISGGAECPNGLAAEVAADQLRGLFTAGEQILYTRKSRIGSRTLRVELADRLSVDTLAGGHTLVFQIPLKAIDPRYLDVAVQNAGPAAVSAPSTSGLDWVTGGGLDWVTGGGLNWGTAPVSSTLTLVNAGNADAYPLITITGPVSAPSVTEAATGRVVAYRDAVATGQTMLIDMSPFSRRVLLDGSDRSAAMTSAQWITIPANTSRVLQFGGSGAGQLTASMQSAWN